MNTESCGERKIAVTYSKVWS